jgi:hypothetical protein
MTALLSSDGLRNLGELWYRKHDRDRVGRISEEKICRAAAYLNTGSRPMLAKRTLLTQSVNRVIELNSHPAQSCKARLTVQFSLSVTLAFVLDEHISPSAV